MFDVWLTMKHWKKKHYNTMEPCELKIYPCVLCSAKFRSRKELDMQNRAKHVRERAFPCIMCGNAFYYKQNLSYHVKRVHRGIGFSCRGESMMN